MIQQQLKTVLAEAGLEEIDAAGKPFDPELHEAVSQQEIRRNRPKATSSSSCAKATSCATACCARPR